MQRNQDNPYYRETCRDDVRVVHFGDADGNGARASRSASTCIYYLLCDGAYSAWHRIRSDEVLQQVVPASRWFAAKCVDPSGFALVGCTVAPGFEFSEFELADTATVLNSHPQHAELIARLAARTR